MVITVISMALYLLVTNPMEREKATLTGSDCPFYQLAFSPDGTLLAAGQQDGTIKVWEVPSGAQFFTFPGHPPPGGNLALAFSPDGKILAWSQEKAIFFLNLKTKKVEKQFEDHGSKVNAMVFSPDGKILVTVTGWREGMVRFWDLATKKSKVVFEEGKSKYDKRGYPYIASLAMNPGGKTVAIGIFGRCVLLDIGNGEIRAVTPYYPLEIKPLTFTPVGKRLAGRTGPIQIWDSESGKELETLNVKRAEGPHWGSIGCFAFSPDCKWLAIGVNTIPSHPSYVHIWDFEKQREIGNFMCHNHFTRQIAWSPDGKFLATASQDETVKIWDAPALLRKFGK